MGKPKVDFVEQPPDYVEPRSETGTIVDQDDLGHPEDDDLDE